MSIDEYPVQTDGSPCSKRSPLDEQIRALGRRELAVVLGHAAADVRKVLRAPDTPEVHERVVRLALALQPAVPIVTPIARILELQRQPRATRQLGAAPVAVVTVEVAHRETGELCRATAAEGSLTCPGDHDVEAVVAGDVVANVRDLHDHALAHDRGVSASPRPAAAVFVDLVGESELEALAAIRIAGEAVASRNRRRSEAHAQRLARLEGLVVLAGSGAAARAD
mmetsp:Transcript_87549/g.282934  ORF Transcript_87549/g.282934 Transcript_87549/m.282934 type:complete len:225 (+) Transcript_87549:335-1009(+)